VYIILHVCITSQTLTMENLIIRINCTICFFLCQSLMIRSFIKAGFDTPINSRVIAALSLTKFIPYPSDIKDMLIYYNAYVGGYPPYLPEGQLKDIIQQKKQIFFQLKDYTKKHFGKNSLNCIHALMKMMNYISHLWSPVLSFSEDFIIYGKS